jgi:ATP phosphoribosyltransferase
MTLTIARAKGKLLAGAERVLAAAGLPVPNGEGRKLVVEREGFRFLLVKDTDVPTYVEYGVADCGIVGRDVLLESGSDLYEPLDLAFGRCRLMVARPRGASPVLPAGVRVATKYPRVSAAWFLARGISAEVVSLSGSVELGAARGLADCIVDVVETGRTLEENGLETVAEVAACSARFVVNRASYHARRADIVPVLDRIAAVVG